MWAVRAIIAAFLAKVGWDLWPTVKGFFVNNKRIALTSFAVILLIFYFLAFASGCATSEEFHQLDPKVYYMPDLAVSVNDTNYGSWGVLPEYFPPKVVMKSPGDIDQIRISTCGRTEVFDKKKKLFSSDKKFEWKYIPNKEESTARVENGESCELLIETFEEGVEGRHSWAVFDFRDSKNYQVKAQISCCGKDIDTVGVSMCVCEQNKLSSIEFPIAMTPITDQKKCEGGWEVLKGGKYWRREIVNRQCNYLFIGDKDPLQQHRHTQRGVEDYPVRGD